MASIGKADNNIKNAVKVSLISKRQHKRSFEVSTKRHALEEVIGFRDGPRDDDDADDADDAASSENKLNTQQRRRVNKND